MQTSYYTDKSKIINSSGLGYLDFRAGLRARYGIVWRDIALAYIVLVPALVAAILMQQWYPGLWMLTVPIAALIIGGAIAYLHLFMHEAAHFNIAADKTNNDLLANIFIGILTGLDVKFYRVMHAAHHRYLGTVQDTEKSYFDAITPMLILDLVTGLKVLKVLLVRKKNMIRHEGQETGGHLVRRSQVVFATSMLLHATLAGCLALAGYWQAGAAWLLGAGVGYPLLSVIRQIMEHRRPDADSSIDYNMTDHGEMHRIFGDSLLSRMLGPAGFNRHLLHHWDPMVSYTCFAEMEAYLMDTEMREYLQASQTTYSRTFLILLRGQ
ncbi:MAG: fatty acid desaturase [Bacteroidetes bacterium]|nr:fatty acid desaturase [Bacteroidota bacterium]